MAKIKCAAIWFNPSKADESNKIISAMHHSDIIAYAKEYGVKMEDDHLEGYLTTKDEFVDRYEAYEIAKENNQLIFPEQDRHWLRSDDVRYAVEG